MDKIDGVDLNQLVLESSNELISVKRRQAAGMIKKQLQRVEQLARDYKYHLDQAAKKKRKLDAVQEKIDKIKAGDWSLLVERKENREKDADDN